jgi:hypothetical protein
MYGLGLDYEALVCDHTFESENSNHSLERYICIHTLRYIAEEALQACKKKLRTETGSSNLI